MELSMIVSVITINLLLSSDNALAIAMASRNLEPAHRKKAVFWGSVCAITLQIILTYIASFLLGIPYLKIVGGLVLAWIASKMIVDDNPAAECEANDIPCSLAGAIRSIAIANIIMSLDNVLAVAAVAKGSSLLLGLGVLISFPIIMWGSVLISGLLEKFPVLVWMGAVFLGWTAGGIISSDAFVSSVLVRFNITHTTLPALIALAVSFLAWREASSKARVLDR